MVTSRIQELTEPAVFVRGVTNANGVLIGAAASFWLDKMTWKPVERFNEDFPKPEFVPVAGLWQKYVPSMLGKGL